MPEKTLKEKTAKGLMWGTISNGAQLVLGTLFGIFLARILSPSDYGMVGLLTVFSQIASVLQDSGFRTALANRREIVHEDYNAVFWFTCYYSSWHPSLRNFTSTQMLRLIKTCPNLPHWHVSRSLAS